MHIRKPVHIETQDPRFFAFRREVALLWLVWGGLSLAAWRFWGDIALLLSLIGLGALLLYYLLRVYHKLQVEQFQHYWQTEALFSLYSSVPITRPLPPLRLWAASPDFVVLDVALIKQHRPRVILEIGSGVSTLIAGYCLREIGEGIVVSLEHDERFAQSTAENIIQHGLQDFAQVIYAPLKPISLSQTTHLWYDTSQLASLPPIDLLIVDGPPEKTQVMARYPAVPILFNKLANGALILVDDFMRPDEYEMVNQWLRDYNLTIVNTFANEKGAAILRKTQAED